MTEVIIKEIYYMPDIGLLTTRILFFTEITHSSKIEADWNSNFVVLFGTVQLLIGWRKCTLR